jgi:hypothetical protein
MSTTSDSTLRFLTDIPNFSSVRIVMPSEAKETSTFIIPCGGVGADSVTSNGWPWLAT